MDARGKVIMRQQLSRGRLERHMAKYRGRGPITKNQVAALLRDDDIRSVVVHPTKRADFSRHGYRAAQFDDAFAFLASRAEHPNIQARGDVMFGCLPLDGPHREGGLLAGLRTYLPLSRTTLTQQLFGPRPEFRRPCPAAAPILRVIVACGS
jgi:hypothetical protein